MTKAFVTMIAGLGFIASCGIVFRLFVTDPNWIDYVIYAVAVLGVPRLIEFYIGGVNHNGDNV